MPFTLAHPSIVLPLKKSGLKLSMTGLVMGSMVPDFEFFIQMREVENIGHHWYGIFLFDLPAAIILAFFFHNILRNVLINNLPKIYKSRFIKLNTFDWNKYFVNNKSMVLKSIVIGVVSHLLWDSFTHYDGVFVELFPILSHEINLLNTETPIYFLLQILFSIIGMIALHLQVIRMPRYEITNNTKIDYRFWLTFILIFAAGFSLRFIISPEFNSFGEFAIAIMGTAFYSIIPVSILFNNIIVKKDFNMDLTTNTFKLADEDETYLLIKSGDNLNSNTSERLRNTVSSSIAKEITSIYLDVKDVTEVDLSGINEVINTHYTLKRFSKKLVLVYRRNSCVEKWISTTGLNKFINTAIVE